MFYSEIFYYFTKIKYIKLYFRLFKDSLSYFFNSAGNLFVTWQSRDVTLQIRIDKIRIEEIRRRTLFLSFSFSLLFCKSRFSPSELWKTNPREQMLFCQTYPPNPLTAISPPETSEQEPSGKRRWSEKSSFIFSAYAFLFSFSDITQTCLPAVIQSLR